MSVFSIVSSQLSGSFKAEIALLGQDSHLKMGIYNRSGTDNHH